MFSIFPRNEAILTCNYHRASLWLRQERIHLQCRDLCSILGLGGSRGEGIGYPLQYSCLENSMDRGAWWATVHGVAKSHDLVTKHSRNSTGKNTGESFAQWQYRSQWGLSEARWLLIEKKKKNTGEGCHSLLQGIFLTQGSNPHLLHLQHWQADSLPQVPPGKPQHNIHAKEI